MDGGILEGLTCNPSNWLLGMELMEPRRMLTRVEFLHEEKHQGSLHPARQASGAE